MTKPSITIRVGIPEVTGEIPRAMHRIEQPVLVSAGALWQPEREYFTGLGMLLIRMDAALDSGGFERGRTGYPWTVDAYVDIACAHTFAWWSQMDLPCEAAIAPDRKTVIARIEESAKLYTECAASARRWTGRYHGAQAPTPIFQGRLLEDYARSADLLTTACGGRLPDFVGVGSMCTRPLHGPEGLLPIVEGLDRLLPSHVKLHLFGVKGIALRHLRGSTRVTSVDSMAWDKRASWLWNVEKKRLHSSRTQHRIACMKNWLSTQQSYLAGEPEDSDDGLGEAATG